jgi:Cof subfamily protein (haloacid dehalogenase superfamily)
MIPKLFAFDLDGTLLDSNKRIRAAKINALREIKASGAVVSLASGRLGSAMRWYVPDLGFDPALVVLNGAEVFTSAGEDVPRIRYAPLGQAHAEYLTSFGKDKPVAVNFYWQDNVYTVKSHINMEWTDLYHQQTGVKYALLDDFSEMDDAIPSKIIYVGGVAYIDELERYFRSMWSGKEVYVCRSWRHYLEFMNPIATKGLGLKVLCDALGVKMSEVAAYGDEENDIPMIEAVGTGVAMKNATEKVKKAAQRITEMTNDEDWVAREWEVFLKNSA